MAHQRKETAQAEYKKWVESHTVEEIAAANIARQHLRRLKKEKNTEAASPRKKIPAKRLRFIDDERRVKRPIASPYVQFSINRHASGDFRNIRFEERAKLIGQEWKALSQEEKDVSCSLPHGRDLMHNVHDANVEAEIQAALERGLETIQGRIYHCSWPPASFFHG